ncbi:MAG TPA: imidazole glycerol phosphate synthase subunit HisH [Vicinamibacterales bacterium]|nr:imidazole glycerol phosphate synthase subunit HisH [Vicinamibacterales bacterium]
MIALVDYGAGNLTSVRKALAALEADVVVPRTVDQLAIATGIIVPGVGHFDRTSAIDASWRDAIRAAVDRGAALFGICLGMQWLFEGSDEAPELRGFGAFRGTCAKLTPTSPTSPTRPTRLKVPHVGWNSLETPRASDLMRDVPGGAQVYFTHSFAAPVVAETAATTTYGSTFTAAVAHGRIAGVQFHPEKSGDVGLRILRNWLVVNTKL